MLNVEVPIYKCMQGCSLYGALCMSIGGHISGIGPYQLPDYSSGYLILEPPEMNNEVLLSWTLEVCDA